MKNGHPKSLGPGLEIHFPRQIMGVGLGHRTKWTRAYESRWKLLSKSKFIFHFLFFISLHTLLLSLNVREHLDVKPDFMARGPGNSDAKT